MANPLGLKANDSGFGMNGYTRGDESGRITPRGPISRSRSSRIRTRYQPLRALRVSLRRFLADEGPDTLTRQINDTCDEESEDLSAVAHSDLVSPGLWEW